MLTTGTALFDSEVGGLSAYGVHLLVGAPASVTTDFGLRFLGQGLKAGEKTALITALRPAEALESARAAGMNFADYARRQALLIFDYPEDLQENLRGVSSDEAIAQELLHHLGEEGIDRLVIDPISPLIAGLDTFAMVRRLKAAVNEIQSLNATTLLIAGGRTGHTVADRCSVLFDDILRLDQPEPNSEAARIVIQQSRHPAITGRTVWLHPELRPEHPEQPVRRVATVVPDPPATERRREPLAIPEPARLLLPAPVARPKVLVMDPVESRRSEVRQLVSAFADCFEARGIVDGYGLMWSEKPDLFVIAEQLPGLSGLDLVRKLRATGRDLPIIVVGGQLRRIEDELVLLEAGADCCFAQPLPNRVFQWTVLNWIRRTRPAFAHLTLDQLSDSPQYGDIGCTHDLDYLCRRVEDHIRQRGADHAGLSAVAIGVSGSAQSLEEFAAVCTMTIRKDDLVWVGARGVIVLLNNCRDTSAFVARLYGRCSVRPLPRHEVIGFDARFMESVRAAAIELSTARDTSSGGDIPSAWSETLRRAQSAAQASMGALNHAS